MTHPLKCFIIDDEPDSRELIKKFVERIPFLTVCGESEDAIDALLQVQKIKPDLVFLDVEMPQINGFEFIRTLNGKCPKIIMITAYAQYALEGFEHQVTDYLVKPVSFERFMKAVNKFMEYFIIVPQILSPTTENSLKTTDISNDHSAKPAKENEFILIKNEKKMIRVAVTDIVMIEAMKDYIKVHLAEKVIITHSTLTKMEQLLPANKFLRISRSCIIRENAISEIDGNEITTINGKKADIGVTYRETVWNTLKTEVNK
ncbi:LytR/AlgR family response regulator transcription factor [Dyadobacter frigoris]|uniref:Response regulator transcription factor n=1 Tax=Dyadobacter frigoris TaxID=2576211 RepID=A0A4U6CWY3_9BACT|nr:LytTR family DNA-binding domain-containing protein [Dyadobacter frigoris]TKT89370.1 response regulator transcription factor [Dyadobacter frigoris]GLU55491.1 DNA-binding response regulator [Dyadobacter frigoris]